MKVHIRWELAKQLIVKAHNGPIPAIKYLRSSQIFGIEASKDIVDNLVRGHFSLEQTHSLGAVQPALLIMEIDCNDITLDITNMPAQEVLTARHTTL